MSNSRLALRNTAVRTKMFARCMLSGPPGAGKTMTALEIACELVKGDMSKVTVMDTEKDSALTYAEGKFMGFQHLPWDPPYAPRELGQTVIDAGNDDNTEVIIIDSLTHFWKKRGGTMDIADGKFGGWKTARPVQEEMVDALLGTKAHVIICVRSKIEYAQMEDPRRAGRQQVVKMGMAPQQDGDLEYEFNVAVELDMEHQMFVGKSRTSDIPVGTTYGPGMAANFAATYSDWLEAGTAIDAPTIEALQVTLGQLRPEVVGRMRELWTERGLPAITALNPAQVLRVVGLIAQAKQDFEQATGQSAEQPTQAPQQQPPAQQPQQQAIAPQSATQPPQQAPQQQQPQQQPQYSEPVPSQHGQPQYSGGSMAQQPQPDYSTEMQQHQQQHGGYAQNAGSSALQQQRQAAQERVSYGGGPAALEDSTYFQQ